VSIGSYRKSSERSRITFIPANSDMNTFSSVVFVVLVGLLGVTSSSSLRTSARLIEQIQSLTLYTDADCTSVKGTKTDSFTQAFTSGEQLFFKTNGL